LQTTYLQVLYRLRNVCNVLCLSFKLFKELVQSKHNGLQYDKRPSLQVEIKKLIHFVLNFNNTNILTTNRGFISLKVFNVNNGILLEKLMSVP